MNRNFLYVFRKAPHEGNAGQELADMALLTAAFEQECAILFIDDGVYQIKTQQSNGADSSNPSGIFLSFHLYGITSLFVEEESLSNRALVPVDLSLPVTLIAKDNISSLLQRYQRIIGI